MLQLFRSDRIPVGVWIRLRFKDQPPLVGFTYVDRREGFSIQGYSQSGAELRKNARIILRLPVLNTTWEVLEPTEVASFGLETPPTWVEEIYGEQPQPGLIWGWWRDHPHLAGRLDPVLPDELEVLIHDGGPFVTLTPPEKLTVRIIGVRDDVFQAQLLESPQRVTRVRHLEDLHFIVPPGGATPMLVTEKYLQERNSWQIPKCPQCGLSELFDAPSDLAPVEEGRPVTQFTTACPVCKSSRPVQHREHGKTQPRLVKSAPGEVTTERPWWRFWK